MSMKDYFCIVNQSNKPDYEIFRSNVCHYVHNMGDLKFIIYLLENDYVRKYWNQNWHKESFYLLATLDYLCRLHDMPFCKNYDDIRQFSLEDLLYPRDVKLASVLLENDMREELIKNSIPEYIRFNIVEDDIRNVC